MKLELKSKEGLLAVVDSLGGELKSLTFNGREIMWDGNSRFFPVTSPNLFPFIGRLYQGKYLYENREYPMGIHGFLARMEMEVCEKEEDRVVLQLKDNEKTREEYPFSFVLEIEYVLSGKTIYMNTTVRNSDKEKKLIFSVGGHPGFALDTKGGKEFSDYYLEFSEECKPIQQTWDENWLWHASSSYHGLEDNRRLWLDKEIFSKDAIVLGNTPGKLSIRCKGSDTAVTIGYEDFPFVGIWHPYGSDDSFICIEPWYGLPGRGNTLETLEEKPYTITLEPSCEKTFTWTVTVG